MQAFDIERLGEVMDVIEENPEEQFPIHYMKLTKKQVASVMLADQKFGVIGFVYEIVRNPNELGIIVKSPNKEGVYATQD